MYDIDSMQDFDKSSKYYAYIYTLNNWTQEEYENIQKLKYQYILIGKEIAPTTGTPHLQGYIYFTNKISFKSLCKQMPRARIAKAKGTAKQNRVYCMKGGDCFEDGDMPVQGERTDIELAKEIVNKTGKIGDVVSLVTSYQSVRMAETILKYHEKKRNWKPLVKWYWGPTGSGKTKTAFEELQDPYVCTDSAKWWDGYDAHENVIIDDFRENFISFNGLLRLLDRYAYRIECKGGSRQLLAKTIIITTPNHPNETFSKNGDEDIKQLIRRIDEIKMFE
uniref:hypothetical protein n=1 Tax=Polynucleobacter sp. TaxID=2029855 RepID=UPI004047E072